MRLIGTTGSILQYFKSESDTRCKEDRELLKECILKSICFERTHNYKQCINNEIDHKCIPLKTHYKECKKSTYFEDKEAINSIDNN